MERISTIGFGDLSPIEFVLRGKNEWGLERLINGLLRLEPNALVLEYEQKSGGLEQVINRFTGLRKEGVATRSIPYGDLVDLKIVKPLLGKTAILLKVNKLSLLQDVPAAKGSTVKLEIKTADRKEAEAVVSRALLIRSEDNLNKFSS